MKQCKHKRWGKWTILQTRMGVLIQTKQCKKCGWTEYEETTYYSPKEFKVNIKPIVKELLGEINQPEKIKKKGHKQ